MIAAGDEVGKTQKGNNNAYCQNNEISWFDWSLAESEEGASLLEFMHSLLALRRDHIIFRRSRYFRGEIIPDTEVKDVTWLRADGAEMTEKDWHDNDLRFIAMLLSGEAGAKHITLRGEPEPDDTFLLMMNAADQGVAVTVPESRTAAADGSLKEDSGYWAVVVDTSATLGSGMRFQSEIPPRSLLVLVRRESQ